jgi:tRNA 5-methylaminomethyl-2-thiouridine biosynthesis bifunctional protein
VAHDRLPLAGLVADEAGALSNAPALRGAHLADLPRRAGLYASFALGSRGLTLAPLAGELIAAQLEGEPWPVERDLAAAIDPARFLLRRLRSGRSA